MLSQLLFVRLKTAEKALRDGRLDEAYRLATAPDLRQHHRATAVLAALAERFLERARAHFRADRFTEALIDLERADAGGVMQDAITELRTHVRTVQAEEQRKERARQERLNTAKRRIEGGSLAAGRRILEGASEGDHGARQLRREAEERAEEVVNALTAAEGLVAQGQLGAAAERVRRARSVEAHHEGLARIEALVCNKVFSNARSFLLEGRLRRAGDELACLDALGEALPARRELTEMLALARRAGESIRLHYYGEARRQVMSLARLLPGAAWIEHAGKQLRTLEELHTELAAGPLGETSDSAVAAPAPKRERPTRKAVALDDTVPLPDRAPSEGPLPERLLLLVDGGGSFLILRGPQASIGRAATVQQADVAILSDLAERHANVSRVDDDYFLFGARPIEVSGQKTKHHLLRDGDRIVLGRKAKLTFRLPSRKTATAVLDLSDTTKMPNDVRRVVLFSRHATIGQGPTAHIYCRHASPPLVLFERSGTLWIRPKSDGHVDTAAQPLRIGEPTEIAGASLVLEPWVIRAPGDATL